MISIGIRTRPLRLGPFGLGKRKHLAPAPAAVRVDVEEDGFVTVFPVMEGKGSR